MMKQFQLYKYATWTLLVLNLALIAFFVFTKPQPPPNRGGKKFSEKAVDILKLDGQQQDRFLQAAKQHNQQMETINGQQQDLLKPYFNSLINTDQQVNSDTLLQQIQQLERNKIESTYRHFQEVKSMLNSEQQAGFEEFVNHALEIILLDKKKNPPPPKDF
jgi:hypothetical protein